MPAREGGLVFRADGESVRCCKLKHGIYVRLEVVNVGNRGNELESGA